MKIHIILFTFLCVLAGGCTYLGHKVEPVVLAQPKLIGLVRAGTMIVEEEGYTIPIYVDIGNIGEKEVLIECAPSTVVQWEDKEHPIIHQWETNYTYESANFLGSTYGWNNSFQRNAYCRLSPKLLGNWKLWIKQCRSVIPTEDEQQHQYHQCGYQFNRMYIFLSKKVPLETWKSRNYHVNILTRTINGFSYTIYTNILGKDLILLDDSSTPRPEEKDKKPRKYYQEKTPPIEI